MQMQDDIHKLKKLMDSVFDKMYVASLFELSMVPFAPPGNE